nr:ribose 5-phosphate isomerase A [Terrilactibacillus laevilacticus]
MKQECAQAASKLIRDHSIIGLGGGSTITYLIQYIKQQNLHVNIVTPSFTTKSLCLRNGLNVLHTSFIDHIDIAFDGCDEVDKDFNALKSGGGIHTKEKLIANMANEYILLVDESKFVSALTFKQPIVLEVLEDALEYVSKTIIELGGEPNYRKSAVKDGVTISDNGHLLIDATFDHVEDIPKLEDQLNSISGVIDTSLFTKVITKVIVAKEDGIEVYSKNDQSYRVKIHE